MGGGGGFIPTPTETIRDRIERARNDERERFNKEIDKFLRELLVQFNDRDADETKENLDTVISKISDVIEVEQLMFGGSVAKHTYVDGISDVDALVVIDRSDLRGKSPKELLSAFQRNLRDNLTSDVVESVEMGEMAITVRFVDKSDIQILPALRSGRKVLISAAGGKEWKETDPKIFQRTLTRSNVKVGGHLVPAIKLLKSIVSDFPSNYRLTGYHIESLSVDAVRKYDGPSTTKDVLKHLILHSSRRVLRPIGDVTGQSRIVDDYLGKRNNQTRQEVSQALASVGRRLESATTIAQWKALLRE